MKKQGKFLAKVFAGMFILSTAFSPLQNFISVYAEESGNESNVTEQSKVKAVEQEEAETTKKANDERSEEQTNDSQSTPVSNVPSETSEEQGSESLKQISLNEENVSSNDFPIGSLKTEDTKIDPNGTFTAFTEEAATEYLNGLKEKAPEFQINTGVGGTVYIKHGDDVIYTIDSDSDSYETYVYTGTDDEDIEIYACADLGYHISTMFYQGRENVEESYGEDFLEENEEPSEKSFTYKMKRVDAFSVIFFEQDTPSRVMRMKVSARASSYYVGQTFTGQLSITNSYPTFGNVSGSDSGDVAQAVGVYADRFELASYNGIIEELMKSYNFTGLEMRPGVSHPAYQTAIPAGIYLGCEQPGKAAPNGVPIPDPIKDKGYPQNGNPYNYKAQIAEIGTDGSITLDVWVDEAEMQNHYWYFYPTKHAPCQAFGGRLHFKTSEVTFTATVNKSSSNVQITAGNSNYSLEGAVYGVFSNEACTDQITTITTGANGSGSTEVTVSADVKTVYIKETSAPKGYKLNPTVYPITVDANPSPVDTSDEPETGKFKLTKQTNSGKPLSGAAFVLRGPDGRIYAPTASTTNANGEMVWENLPLGDYTATETSAPPGYSLLALPLHFTITVDGKEPSITVGENEIVTLNTGGNGFGYVFFPVAIAAAALAVLFKKKQQEGGF